MIYAIAVVAIQVMTILHVVRSGRTQPWLFVVLFLPLVGSIAYLIAEVLPEFLNSKTARTAADAARDRLDPDRLVRALHEEAMSAQTPQAYAKLAHEYARLDRYVEAGQAYDLAMTGIFADDQDLIFAKAATIFDGAEHGALPWSDARRAWERLDGVDPTYRPKDRSLLRARLAQAEGDTETAEREYAGLTTGYATIETRVRFAHFLYVQGRLAEARQVLEALDRDAAKAAPHVRDMNRKWFDQAQTALDIVNRAEANL